MDEMYFSDFYYQNGTILGWNKEQIYLGENYSNKFEIIQNIDKSKNYKIILIYLNPNIIFYENPTNPKIGKKDEDFFIEDENQ